MAERDTFEDVNNGDQLNEGYFNNIHDSITQKNEIINAINIEAIFNDTDVATTYRVTGPNFKFELVIDTTKIEFDGTSAGDTKTNCFVDVNGTGASDIIYGIQAYDLCNNSAVDGALWTSAGSAVASENTTYLQNRVTSSGGEGSKNGTVKTNDLSNSKAADFNILVRTNLLVTTVAVGTSPTGTATLRLTDDVDVINIATVTRTGADGTSTISGLYEIRYDQGTDTVDIYKDGSIDQSGVDVSALSTIKLELFCLADRDATAGNSVTTDARVFGVFADVASGTATFETNNETLDANAVDASVYADATLNSGTIAYQVSSNGGSNYDTITPVNNYGRERITNQSNSARVKFNFTLSADPEADGIPEIDAYGAYFNF